MDAPLRVREPAQARSKRTREALLVAGAVEFSELGYARTTTKSIAERAGVATGSFYQYFVDKDALLRELAVERQVKVAADVLAVVTLPARGSGPSRPGAAQLKTQIAAIVELVMRAHREDPNLHAVLTERRYADRELDASSAVGERALCDAIAAMLRCWAFVGDSPAVAFVLFSMCEGAVHGHVLGQPVVSDVRFTRALVDALICVISRGPSKGRVATPKSKER